MARTPHLANAGPRHCCTCAVRSAPCATPPAPRASHTRTHVPYPARCTEKAGARERGLKKTRCPEAAHRGHGAVQEAAKGGRVSPLPTLRRAWRLRTLRCADQLLPTLLLRKRRPTVVSRVLRRLSVRGGRAARLRVCVCACACARVVGGMGVLLRARGHIPGYSWATGPTHAPVLASCRRRGRGNLTARPSPDPTHVLSSRLPRCPRARVRLPHRHDTANALRAGTSLPTCTARRVAKAAASMAARAAAAAAAAASTAARGAASARKGIRTANPPKKRGTTPRTSTSPASWSAW